MGTEQDCSPEHNRLQSRFLTDENFVRALITKVGKSNNSFEMSDIEFEKEFLVNCFIDIFITLEKIESREIDAYLFIELKPTIGEDYPKILRQMSKYPSHSHGHYNEKIVYTDSYEGSVDLDQVKQIFKRSGVWLFTSQDFLQGTS